MNECCQRLFREAKKELEIKDRRLAILEAEVTRVFEPTRQFWNNENEVKIKSLEQRLKDAEEVIGFYKDATNNPKKYMRQGYEVYNLKKAIFIDGGEKAREYFEKYKKDEG